MRFRSAPHRPRVERVHYRTVTPSIGKSSATALGHGEIGIVILARILADVTGLLTLALLCGLGLGLFLGLQELRAHWTVYAVVYAVIAASGWLGLVAPGPGRKLHPVAHIGPGIDRARRGVLCVRPRDRTTDPRRPAVLRRRVPRDRPPGFWRHSPCLPGLMLITLCGWSRSLVLPPCDPIRATLDRSGSVIEYFT